MGVGDPELRNTPSDPTVSVVGWESGVDTRRSVNQMDVSLEGNGLLSTV